MIEARSYERKILTVFFVSMYGTANIPAIPATTKDPTKRFERRNWLILLLISFNESTLLIVNDCAS